LDNVRSRCILGLLVALLGCREGATTTPPRAPAGDVAVAPQLRRPPGAGAPSASETERGQPARSASQPALSAALPAAPALSSGIAGNLERTDRLGHLFEQLAALDDGHARQDVVILQYGDSHTASDLGVSVLRHALQARFGEGGRGFVPLGRPWKTYSEDGVRGGMTKEFEPVKVTFSRAGGVIAGDGAFGLLGVGVETSRPARAWTDVTARASHVELAYLQQPRGGSFDVLVDGAPAGHVATRAPQLASGYFAFDVPDAPHTIEVHAAGDGAVRLFGMTLDRSEAGVVVDALGINGAQIYTPLHWNEEHFTEQLRHAGPDLVALAYGTNEALDQDLLDAEYERKLAELLGRVARAVPNASCLLLGPPDLARRAKGQTEWRTWPRLVEIVGMQRRVAQAAGCAFYDQFAAMGGPGSIGAWALGPDPRARGDRVHLTRAGYAQLATSLATDLMRAYDEWRAERGLPHRPQKTWGVASR
jgi:lysophospholipase L1-like esterase